MNQKREWRKELRKLYSQQNWARKHFDKELLMLRRRFDKDLTRLNRLSEGAEVQIDRRIAVLEGRLS